MFRHGHCGSGQIIFSVCQVIWQDHMIKGSLDFREVVPGGHRHCGSGDMMFLVCYVIPEVHVIKGSSTFLGMSSIM